MWVITACTVIAWLARCTKNRSRGMIVSTLCYHYVCCVVPSNAAARLWCFAAQPCHSCSPAAQILWNTHSTNNLSSCIAITQTHWSQIGSIGMPRHAAMSCCFWLPVRIFSCFVEQQTTLAQAQCVACRASSLANMGEKRSAMA